MIYVDSLFVSPRMPRAKWCHMMTDGPLAELHMFAARIGLRREWFQNHKSHPHYDVSERYRTFAIRAGAQVISSRDMVNKCSRFRKEVMSRDTIPIPKHSKSKSVYLELHRTKEK